jgi:GNAT superfamily N-acetyltransferase
VATTPALAIHPATPDRWDDLVELFGDRGATSGCWCMFFRISSGEFSRDAGPRARAAIRDLVRGGAEPGLLAYAQAKPVGWCSVAPREEFQRILRSPTLRPFDQRPAWSVVCFYVDRAARGCGVAERLLDAAVEHATAAGAELLEGYPRDVSDRVRPIMRLVLGPAGRHASGPLTRIVRPSGGRGCAGSRSPRSRPAGRSPARTPARG